jgi:hypothetical protein
MLITNNNCLLFSGDDGEFIYVSSIDFSGNIQWTQTICDLVDGVYISTPPIIDSNKAIYLPVLLSSNILKIFALS